MNPLLFPLIEFGKTLIDRLIPDSTANAAAQLELVKSAQAGELQQVLTQLQINAKEADSQSVFISGWRPFVGWTCGFGLAYSTILHNMLEWLSTIQGWPAPPGVDTETLLYVLGSLLGIGGLRTYEKVKGVASK